ncbi:MAG: hypothetical protein JXB05_27510 [Myxococcaceae bacterium]|nr:hypothetical protein [Myxococcaceae bacterium]
MPGPLHPHRIARWLRLGLASLALALGAVPAHAQPASPAVATLSVERRESARQLTAADTAVHSRRAVGRATKRSHARPSSVSNVPEPHPPGPPRRLFILHRALLH